MGAASGGVSVKIDTSKYDLEKIIKDLIGEDFVKTDKYLDTRYPDNYFLVKTKEVITIFNSEFVERFYNRQDTSDIQNIIDYFQKPELIFAHERYDSGGTYSYALIYSGELKRQFRSLSYETKIDFGELEEVEKEWKNGEVKKFDLGAGDFEVTVKNLNTGQVCDEANIPQAILDKLQYDLLGFDDDDSKIIERAFFVKELNPPKMDNDPKKVLQPKKEEKTKPRWRFW